MHYGPAVANYDAFYLVVNISHNQAIFGPLGGLVNCLEQSPGELGAVTVTTVATLPDSVTSHPEWPKNIVSKRRVIVVPRGAIHEIRRPGLGGQIVLETEQERFSVGLKFFGKKKTLSWLREDLKWPIP
jgi:hypothetical protein